VDLIETALPEPVTAVEIEEAARILRQLVDRQLQVNDRKDGRGPITAITPRSAAMMRSAGVRSA
jgi:hypothetical protein